MRREIVLIAAFVVLCAAILVWGVADAEPHHGGSEPCGGHQHMHNRGDVTPLAKRAWKRPSGPKRAHRVRYRHVRHCAYHPAKIAGRWKATKKRYAPRRERLRLWKRCGNDNVDACIDYAARYKGGDGAWMHRVAWCESRKNPRASNGTHHGLFQYAPGTWGTTPYGGKSIWSARWQSLATAWMLRQGRAGEWACA